MTTSQDHLNNKNISKNTDNKDNFAQVVFDGRSLLKNKKEFQNEEWKWATELDDDGMFKGTTSHHCRRIETYTTCMHVCVYIFPTTIYNNTTEGK